jgi:peptide chain release factor 1
LKPSLRAKLDSLAQRLEELNRLLSAESATRDMNEFKKLSREHAEVSGKVDLYNQYR